MNNDEVELEAELENFKKKFISPSRSAELDRFTVAVSPAQYDYFQRILGQIGIDLEPMPKKKWWQWWKK